MRAAADPTLPPPGLSPVCGKPVVARFDGGRLSSDGGIALLAGVERRLKIAERLARCVEDPRAPEQIRRQVAEMIRFRALAIAAGCPDANDCDAVREDPAFKTAVGRLTETAAELCSQPTMMRLENLPGAGALKRMMAAIVELFCGSFDAVPRRIVLDIDDTEDRAHGGRQLCLFNAHHDSRFIVTKLAGLAKSLSEKICCARGQAPNSSFWRDAQFDTLRLGRIKVAVRVTELVARIKLSPPTGFATLAARLAKLPPGRRRPMW